ncbi:MAG: TylF/MycF/NovP-related O-methyltransferase [Chloroflexota bacterium]|nr:TylF/MycF/NovP-related O-methyltransferase [Chloroflexota bacterium]
MNVGGSTDSIFCEFEKTHPEIGGVLSDIDARIARKPRREVERYQAAALYALAKTYNGKPILEIGTAVGYSAAVIAAAAPSAAIVTLNPNEAEAAIARVNLAPCPNVTVMTIASLDYLGVRHPVSDVPDGAPEQDFSFIFVDGDHARVRLDFAYWDRLAPGGMIVFHDYSPAGTWRACPPVYEACQDFAAWLGRADVLIVDNQGVGMIGWIKRMGDPMWQFRLDEPSPVLLNAASAASVQPANRLAKLWRLCLSAHEVPGAIVSLGAGMGGAAALIERAVGGEDRQVWLFDTWGNAEQPGERDGAKAHARYADRLKAGRHDDVADAIRVMQDWGIGSAHYVTGHISDTVQVRSEDIGVIAVLHIDTDSYAPTLLSLLSLYEHVAQGGLIICDDYGHWQGARLAVDEFRAKMQIVSPLMALDKTAHWWRKDG